jgi:cytochrome c-type biogenesis protein CcmH
MAVEPDEILKDPAMEARAREIGRELRCVVCQSQSIDDSNAPLARDLRLLVRERLVAGDSNDEVLDYVTARYGDYVLLKPRMSAGTVLLWLSPLALLFAGGGIALVYLRERTRPAPQTALSDEEQKRLDELTDE